MKKNYSKLFNLKNKVSIILGSSKGIGKEIFNGFNSFGCETYGIGRSSRNNINNYFKCDINDTNSLEKVFKTIFEKHNKIDILVNCAAVTNVNKFNKHDNFKKILNNNLISQYISSNIFYKYTKSKRGGSIINIGSIGSKLGFPNNPGYVSSKTGIIGLTKALALDFSKKNVRVNCILPGYIKTSMTIKSYKNKSEKKKRSDRTIMKRWGLPSDIVGAAIYLASDSSNYVTGSEIVVDGGWLAKGL